MSDDAKYLEKLASGDHQAYEYLFIKYFPKVKYYIDHFVKSEAIAEELSQDIFEKIWINRLNLIHLNSFNAYLYRMSKNRAINYLEHQYIERSFIDNYTREQDYRMDEELNAKEIELLILLEVERMPEQRKRIFMLSRFEQLKNEEIAQKLGITKKTVENHLNLALKQIRRFISLIILFFF